MDPIIEKNKKIFRRVLLVLRILCVLIAIDGVFLIARNVVNNGFLRDYESGRYAESPEKLFLHTLFGERYVVPYNLGNVKCIWGDYEKAVDYYRKALRSNPPEIDQECKIRVNLAFAMCHTIDFDNLDYSDEDAVNKAIATLTSARAVLTDHECASMPVGSEDGHFHDADLLKHDIDEMLQKLQNQDKSGDGQDENQDQNKDQNQDDSQSDDKDKDKDKDQGDGQNQDKNKDEQQTEAQKARQDEVKEQLEKQKRDLENGTSSENNGFDYIDGGESKGYGDGTLW